MEHHPDEDPLGKEYLWQPTGFYRSGTGQGGPQLCCDECEIKEPWEPEEMGGDHWTPYLPPEGPGEPPMVKDAHLKLLPCLTREGPDEMPGEKDAHSKLPPTHEEPLTYLPTEGPEEMPGEEDAHPKHPPTHLHPVPPEET